MAAKLVLPFIVPGHQCCIRPLHQNQHDIIYAVTVKAAHRAKIGFIFLHIAGLKHLLDTGFNAVSDLLQSLFVALLFCHKLLLSLESYSRK